MAKEILSADDNMEYTVFQEALIPDQDYEYELSREYFNDIARPIFERIVPLIEETLSKVNVQREEIQEVVLVGGTTRIPRVKEILQEFFPDIQLKKTVHPDHVVAQGAAILAAIRSE